jgi:RHS repeat-associated protein
LGSDLRNVLIARKLLTVCNFGSTEDAAGNITAIHDAVDATYDRTFTYDDLGRLTGAATAASLWQVGTYAYDATGNMTTRSLGAAPVDDGTILSVRGRKRTTSAVSGYVDTTSFAYQSTTPKLAVVTTNGLDHTVTYDAAGNETQFYASRTYSPRNELASVIDASDEVTQHRIDYGYDGRGVRVMRSESPVPAGAAHRYFFYTPELQLLAITVDDADNPWSQGSSSLATPLATNTEITWFAGLPIAEFGAPRTPQDNQILTVRGRRPRPASLAATTLYYTFTDHLGTPLLQADAAATVTWRVEYEPFGNVWKTRSGNSADQPLRFPGQELAMTWEGGEENYNIFRWYRASFGRYTQSDPVLNLAFAKSLRRFVEDGPTPDFAQPNWYGYAGDNPLSNIDELGLKLTNSTKCVIYVKPENSGVPVLVPPGQTYPGDQDGYAAPCTNPDHVFKTVDNVDADVGPKGPDTDANGFVSAIGQFVKGGWKDEDWKKKLDKKGDHGWDKLFEKSNKIMCLCCAK